MVHELEAENLQRRQKRSRPELLRGTTRRLETPLGTLYVTITEDDRGQPFEVFMSLGKAGGALMADVEAIGRLISLALRSGIPIKEIYRQLRGISSDRVIGLGPNKVLSVPDAVGIAIERWMQEKQGIQQELLPGRRPSEAPEAAVAPVVARAGDGSRRGADDARWHAGDAVRRLSGLRLAAGVRRGVREVPRVRLSASAGDRFPTFVTVVTVSDWKV